MADNIVSCKAKIDTSTALEAARHDISYLNEKDSIVRLPGNTSTKAGKSPKCNYAVRQNE